MKPRRLERETIVSRSGMGIADAKGDGRGKGRRAAPFASTPNDEQPAKMRSSPASVPTRRPAPQPLRVTCALHTACL